MARRFTHSLRARLLWLLFAAITLTAAATAAIAYRGARAEADEIFDYHMQQMAMSLRAGLAPEGPRGRGDTLPGDENFEFVVQVWSADGLRVYESAAHAALPQRAVLGFSTVHARGTTYRVFSMQSRTQVIQVAQDMAARSAMARTLAVRTIAPILVVAPLLMMLAWWVVSSSLAPVDDVRREVARRAAEDLDALAEAGLPDEIAPLVREMNLLFARVREAFDAQKHFVADAAHELRSPLAALSLQVELLRRSPDEPARALAIARLDAGVARATRLVEQLLALARQQAAAAAGAPAERVALAEIARDAVADASPQAQARGIDLGLRHADDATVDGHAEALRVLVANLVDNAIKHVPPGGTVDVEVRGLQTGAVLSVEDSGPGIAEEHLERVTDRFYRVPGTGAEGSGLGLSIAKSVADLHRAALVLDRSARLGGLRARVRFAVAAK